MNWNDVFIYDNGVILWRYNSGRARAGAPAGRLLKDGYLQVKARGKFSRVHRIIWEMHYGKIPDGMQIDHINHCGTDNRIENLRLVTNKENGRNQSFRANNKSGVTGVYFDKFSGKWKAQIKTDVGVKHIGRFGSIEEAANARKMAETMLNYHENHGVKNVSS